MNLTTFTAGQQFCNVMVCTGIASSPIQIRAVTDCAIPLLNFRCLLDNK